MTDREKLVELVHDARMNALWHNAQNPSEYITDMLIANGVTVQEWISVKDRLPEKDDRYATVCDFGNGFVSRGVLGFAKDFSKLVTYQTTAKNVWYEYDREYGFVMITYVTHWMPLPQPPKGE